MDPGLLELIAAGAPGDEVAVIVRLVPGTGPPARLRLITQFGDVATGRAERGALAAIHDNPAVASLKAPRVYAAEMADPFGRPAPLEPGLSEADPTPIDSDVRRPPGLPETGRGTVVAVIDWSIDFAHPDFCDDAGRTRLLCLWDQRAPGGAPPYGYGRIHTREDIDRALAQPDPFAALGYQPTGSPTPAHGTHVLGIAAGNGRAGGPQGIAPEADLIFVHLGPGLGDLGNSVDLLEAIDLVVKAAGERPLAINMSIGRHAGPHDGTLLIERAIDWLIVNRPGTVVVQSAGNYYARDVHTQGRMREARTTRLPFTVPRADAHPVTVELWYKGTDRCDARAIAPDGSVVAAGLGTSGVLVDARGGELGRLYHRARDPNNGDNLIALVLRPMAPAGRWEIEITGTDVADGRWHAWIERNAGCPPCQAKFEGPGISRGTTTGSICNALRTIAVGAYDGHDPGRPLGRFSSVGPTRDGRRKPLLSAPGVRVLSVRSRQSALDPPGYVRMSGTSMAAPHVTGAAALLLEVVGRQPVAVIRQLLFATLDRVAPGEPSEPENRWGYGVLNIATALAAARALRAGHRLSPTYGDAADCADEAFENLDLQELVAMENDHDGGHLSEATMAGPPVTDAERRWTKGRKHTLPSPEQIVLSQFSDDELREMLGHPPRPPIAVASREAEAAPQSTGTQTAPDPADDPAPAPPAEPPADDPLPADPPAAEPSSPAAGQAPSLPPAAPGALPDPKALVNVAVNPQAPSTQVVGWPGARLAIPLIAGDIILRGDHARRRHATMVSRSQLVPRKDVKGRKGRGRPSESGFYVETISEAGIERILGPDGLLLPDVMIVRSRDATGSGEVDPPVTSRPMVRNGTRGPAVSDAQARLNVVHTRRTAAGQPGLDRCPLAVDGVFGRNTQASTIAFQKVAFPANPREWDGIIGPRTWTALIAASQPVAPVPPIPPVPIVSAATIEFVLDDDGDHRVDGRAPVANALMFGLWDKSYDGAGAVANGAAESVNFVGSDIRRFYLRVSDSAAAETSVTAQWRTLTAAGGDDDAPASQDLTLSETAPGSKVFVSRAVMLVADGIDAAQRTHSGFVAGPDAGLRDRGQSNHRLRRARLDGSVFAAYNPAGGAAPVTVTVPVFQRSPDDVRRRLPVRVINYGGHATQAQIDAHFARARLRWVQAGLELDPGAAAVRAIPAAALDADGRYPGERDNAAEVAALADLIDPKVDDTLTVVFVRIPVGTNAYATVFQRTRSALGERFFIFINPDVALGADTLGHEIHHVVFNRGDTPVARQFFSFNTDAPTLRDDPRSYRRIQILRGTDPNNDPANAAVINWVKRGRTQRFLNAAGDLPAPLDAADATTGNTLTRAF